MELKLGQRIGRAVLLEGLTCHLPFGSCRLALTSSPAGIELRRLRRSPDVDDVELSDRIYSRRRAERRPVVQESLGSLPLLDVTVHEGFVYGLEAYGGRLTLNDVARRSKSAGGALPWAAILGLVAPYVAQCRLAASDVDDTPMGLSNSLALCARTDGTVWWEWPTFYVQEDCRTGVLGTQDFFCFSPTPGNRVVGWMWHLSRILLGLAMGESFAGAGGRFLLDLPGRIERLQELVPSSVLPLMQNCFARPCAYAHWDELWVDFHDAQRAEGVLSTAELGSLLRQLAPEEAAFEDELLEQVSLLPADFLDDDDAYVGAQHRAFIERS